MSASLRIALLGELDIRRGETLVVLRSRAQRCVLSVLALHAGRAVPTSALIDALWPDDPPATATASLTNHVHRLRAALGPDIITTRAPGYALAIDPAAIDLHQFAALQRGENTPTDLFTLEAQLALWRDVPFAEFADDEWARPTIVGLIEVHHTLRERRIRKLINAGLFERAIADAESLCASEPLREQPCALLMLALRRAHRTTEALRAYDSFRKRIVNQTGLEPSASLTSLEREIVADLGRSADRDGSTEWGGYAPRHRGSQVPAEVTSLLGRDLDVEEIVQYLAVRPLVTLTGLGGVGKTRVAIRVAHRLRSLFDDVVWVDLAAVRAANEVIGAIAAAMGVASTFGDPLDAISQRTRAGRLLIVLDNCEHVIVESARCAAAIVAAGCETRIVATSREPLAIGAELVHVIEPLGDAAAALFAERAAAVRRGFVVNDANRAAIDAICTALDGLPLAIELAAARSEHLAPPEIARQLVDRFAFLAQNRRDAPHRHRGLAAVIDWSWDLLTTSEQTLLAQLSVFCGGFTINAARAVCEVEGVNEDDMNHALDQVASLVRKSLVVADVTGSSTRYRLLDTVKAYGAARLQEHVEVERVSRRHAVWVADELETIVALLESSSEVAGAVRRDIENSNLNVGVAWALQHGDLELKMACLRPLGQASNALGHLLHVRGHRSAVIDIPGAAQHRHAPWLWASRAAEALAQSPAAAAEAADAAAECRDAPLRARFMPRMHAAFAAHMWGGDAHPHIEAMRTMVEGSDDAMLLTKLAQSEAMSRRIDSPEHLAAVARAFEQADRTGVPSVRASVRVTYGNQRRVADPSDPLAAALLAEAVELAVSVNNTFLLAMSQSMDPPGPTLTERVDHIRRGVAEGPVWVVHGLRTLAETVAGLGDTVSAAVLAGASDVYSVRNWYQAFDPATQAPLSHAAMQAHPDAVARGRRMSMDEAATFLLAALDRVLDSEASRIT